MHLATDAPASRTVAGETEVTEPAPPSTPERAPRWTLWLYGVLTLALLAPIWGVSRFPSVDGPCHLYNAWVLHHLHDPAYPRIAASFQLSLSPVPNLLMQGVLWALLFVAPPVIAEKLLVTSYVLLFIAVAWSYAGVLDRRRSIHAFLALPFVYTFSVHYGFFNSVIAVPLTLLAIAFWWKNRERPSLRLALELNALFLVCYFAHLVALFIGLMTIGLLWLFGLGHQPWRTWRWHPLILLPQLVLPMWFISNHRSDLLDNDWSWAFRWAYFKEMLALFRFPHNELAGLWLCAAFAVLVLVTLLREPRRALGHESVGFFVATLAATALYFFAPGGVGIGTMLAPRLAVLPFLLVLPWLTARVGRPLQAALVLALSALVLWSSVALLRWHRSIAHDVDELVDALEHTPPHSRVVTLIWNRHAAMRQEMLGHATGYAAIAGGLLDWDDYQAATDLFPVHFKPDVKGPEVLEIELEQYRVDEEAYRVDAILTWAMRPDEPKRRALRGFYRTVVRTDRAQLWLRRDAPLSRNLPPPGP
jgi:hypothetical protein